jgi:hypothetical protein
VILVRAWGALVRVVFYRLPDVRDQLDREPSEDGHAGNLGALVQPAADGSEAADGAEGLAYVLREHGDDGALCGQGDLGEPRATLPHHVVVGVAKLGRDSPIFKNYS